MGVPVLPDNAPFTPTQRAWLNGFFAGVLSLESSPTVKSTEVSAAASADQEGISSETHDQIAADSSEENFPWHDPVLPIAERISLAEGRPIAQQMMAAMAQLDCGTCGYLCRTYAQAIMRGDERSLTRCTPGGKETARQLKQLLAQAEA